ncbi:AbrB/MazE/SpoVT family DNA-binding domain-containing protein [Fuchsiella alkaliacetigena]|uniref:AbrB/MazE/SpoVT family DNA-binding domain-containing protein n=1 Tax=Fuchsiella alkaliacetigena TaxID=957042 RepID=UPI00200B488E|nr:AbrB/MazE/SpoVT family DNA-binding domain-containing protein [Fuchsiella alkaliacetigena]MCK8824674.1 AbrB/MazE/SpoVT family DNA-binding domain-containing protein [Fuchsiella alkaliacetigena]
MRSVGVVRKIDNLGRITIPKEVRGNLEIKEGTPMGVYVDGGKVIVKKYEPQCVFCNSTEDVVDFKDELVCSECLSEIEGKVT